ncbi:MAG: type II toxin-antitoxin system HicB family antitoxin [Chloroflexi bacterium]|nr:type II toxin-antitoxin system HicB family antitoxin [Chloroflexota bacterium]
MHKYQITIFWSDEDDVFVADIPELSGRMAHGDSHEDPLAEAQNAISYWLEAARRIGKPIPRPAGELAVPSS